MFGFQPITEAELVTINGRGGSSSDSKPSLQPGNTAGLPSTVSHTSGTPGGGNYGPTGTGNGYNGTVTTVTQVTGSTQEINWGSSTDGSISVGVTNTPAQVSVTTSSNGGNSIVIGTWPFKSK